MEVINISETDNSPKTILDANFTGDQCLIELAGKSYSENTFDFYKPILQWIHDYFNGGSVKKTVVNIKLSYFNSATTQILFDILDILQESKSSDLTIYWYYNANNENSLDDFEDFSEEFPDLNIQSIKL